MDYRIFWVFFRGALKQLDLGDAGSLRYLSLLSVGVESIDFSKALKLGDLKWSNSMAEEIDLSAQTELYSLNVSVSESNSSFNALDLGNNNSLLKLQVYGNNSGSCNLSYIDLSAYSKLYDITLSECEFSDIVFPENNVVKTLKLYGNPISDLNLQGFVHLGHL